MALFGRKPGGSWFGNLLRKITGRGGFSDGEATKDYKGIEEASSLIKYYTGGLL